ncbi:hypothetical protein HDU92_007794, partial [Lobulomyces angularis]
MQVKNNKFEHPRSFFSFLTWHTLSYKTIWCGTHMSIRHIEEFYCCAGEKPSQISVFTDFTYMEADDIKQLLKECLESEIEISLQQELCHFLQGRPRFFATFLSRLMLYKDHEKNSNEVIRHVFEQYRNLLTTAGDKWEIGSVYSHWEKHFYSTVTKLNRGDEYLKTAKLTSDILLNV